MEEQTFSKAYIKDILAIGLGLTLVGCICILFAFSLSSYLRDKEASKRELRAIQEIKSEIAYYEFMIEKGGGRMNEVIAAAERLLHVIRNPQEKASMEDVELDLHKLTWLWLSATPTTKYVSLIHSGDINFISSAELRSELSQFNADQEKLLQFEAIQVRFVDTQLRPFLNKHIDRTVMDSYQKGADLVFNRFQSPFRNTNSSLLQNREFANLLLDLIFCTKRLNLPYSRMQGEAEYMKEIIAKDYPSI